MAERRSSTRTATFSIAPAVVAMIALFGLANRSNPADEEDVMMESVRTAIDNLHLALAGKKMSEVMGALSPALPGGLPLNAEAVKIQAHAAVHLDPGCICNGYQMLDADTASVNVTVNLSGTPCQRFISCSRTEQGWKVNILPEHGVWKPPVPRPEAIAAIDVNLIYGDGTEEAFRRTRNEFSRNPAALGPQREMAAALKRICTAQQKFKAEVSKDRDGDNDGEYAADFLELNGEDVNSTLSQNAVGMTQASMTMTVLGTGVQQGWILRTLTCTALPDATADDDETSFVVFAWPLEYGVTGCEVYAMAEDGAVFVHANPDGSIGNGYWNPVTLQEFFEVPFDNQTIRAEFKPVQ